MQREIKWKETTDLFDMPSPHPSQNPSEGGQRGREQESQHISITVAAGPARRMIGSQIVMLYSMTVML